MFIPVTENDYTRNKADPDAIVSLDANRNLSRVTAAQFESRDAFMRWKQVSDEDYHKSHRGDWRYKDHTVSLGKYESTLSTEHDEQERAERERIHAFYLEVDRMLRKLLTNKEYRRLKMFYTDFYDGKFVSEYRTIKTRDQDHSRRSLYWTITSWCFCWRRWPMSMPTLTCPPMSCEVPTRTESMISRI